MKSRVLSGVQPSGNLHIGNYLGALANWVRIQHDYESIFCIVDLHAITVYQNPAELRSKIREVAALFLASGIDPKHSRIVVQSSVPAHAELAWMLTCVTPMGWLDRMTQFKAKAAAQESVGDGLFQYPVLMAADILLYQAAIVPVGEDQSQHLELTRDIAQRFNSLYGETFTMPATKLPAIGARVMGLDDPAAKMSKSAAGSGHAVGLLDSPERIRKTIMRATTDSNPAVDFDAAIGPGVANLLNIFQAFAEWTDDQMRARFSGLRYGDLKKQVAEMVVSKLEPIQQRYREITEDPAYLDGILQDGAEAVTPIADSTVELVKQRMGLYTVRLRSVGMKKGTFYALAVGSGNYDISFAPDDDAPITDIPPGGPMGKHTVSSPAGLEHFMCMTLRLEMTQEQLNSFAAGNSHRDEISVQNYENYFRG
jgi:tryptophanyl-tRNA synthetase